MFASDFDGGVIPQHQEIDILEALYISLRDTNVIITTLNNWPDYSLQSNGLASEEEEEKQTNHALQLVNQLNVLVASLNQCNKSLLASDNELSKIDVPHDMLTLMDYEDLNPELYVKQLLKVVLNMHKGLTERKDAMKLLGVGIDSFIASRKEARNEIVEEEGQPKKKQKTKE